MRNLTILFALIFIIASSCSIGPEAIHYNEDECAYCKMKISDVRFGAEAVTQKGKIYKYDSAECLIRTCIEEEESKFAFVLVTDYTQPKKLIDARNASFLISENLPSPMGGNLSAYEKHEVASKTLAEKGGKLFNFEALIQEYREIYQ